MKDLEKQLKNVFTETDKSEWSLMKFGDIAREVKETCSNPENEGIERVVGLEHLTPLDIHIRDWKAVSDGTTFTRVFRQGQVLFGRRRAYQRKAALAEFDGLCSGDIIVMEAIEGKLDPNLLPFIVHSDKFYDWAVSTSAGSLSPRTKFKHLAELELMIPPIGVQEKISELLIATESLLERQKSSLGFVSKTRKILFGELTSSKDKVKKLKDCLILSKKRSTPPHKLERYLGLEHIVSGQFTVDSYGSSQDVQSSCAVFEKGQLLYSKLRPNLDKAIIADTAGICTTELLVYDAQVGVNLEYILNHLHSDEFIAYAVKAGFGTKMPRISDKILGDYEIYMPDLNEQKMILSEIANVRKLENSLLKSFESNKNLLQSLTNKIL